MMQFYEFYLSTNLKRSGHLGYLTKEFFEVCLERIMENIVLVLARDKNSNLLVGGSMFFKTKKIYMGVIGAVQQSMTVYTLNAVTTKELNLQ